MKPKIYDCFCFFNEDMLLKLRLETLWNHVDYFVVCESVLTFSGKPKSLHFDITQFEKYKSKIRHLVVRDYPFETNDAWRNDRYQRSFLVNGLFDAEDNDLILVSDVDEIPEPSLIKTYNPARYLRADFEQGYYAYFLNNLNVQNDGSPVAWYGSKITTYAYFKKYFLEIERVRNFKSSGILRGLKKVYFKKFQVQIIKQGGWHFTWIGDFDRIIKKLEATAHQEFNKPEYKNRKIIEDKIRKGEDILREGMQYEIQSLDDKFPEALINNIYFYKQWLIEKE